MALVISRFPDEGFWIGENVRVVVASVKGKKVRLAVTAPVEVDIDRDEVRKRKILEAKAGGSDGADESV